MQIGFFPKQTSLCSFYRWMSEVFTADFSDFLMTQALLFAKHPHRFCLLVWVARSSIPKILESSSSLTSICGHLVEKMGGKSEFDSYSF